MVSLQAPPNREQICRSHPIQFAVPMLVDDREVFTRRMYLGRRKAKLGFRPPDEIGNSDRSVLQFIEDVAANPSAIGNTTHDAALLCRALRRRFVSAPASGIRAERVPPIAAAPSLSQVVRLRLNGGIGIVQPTLSNSSNVVSVRLARIVCSESGPSPAPHLSLHRCEHACGTNPLYEQRRLCAAAARACRRRNSRTQPRSANIVRGSEASADNCRRL